MHGSEMPYAVLLVWQSRNSVKLGPGATGFKSPLCHMTLGLSQSLDLTYLIRWWLLRGSRGGGENSVKSHFDFWSGRKVGTTIARIVLNAELNSSPLPIVEHPAT